MTNDPVFIVGVPRSGTTLLAALLSAHPRFDCGPETVFFSFWAGAAKAAILEDRFWPSLAVRFLTNLPAAFGRVHEAFGLTPADLRDYLLPMAPTPKTMLEALTVPHAQARGKARWIEKSPIHLAHVRAIRAAFPDAWVVRIIRDPRAVAASIRGVPWGTPSAIANAYWWEVMDRGSADFFTADPRSLTVGYERLAADPVGELTTLFARLGESFDPAVLALRSLTGLALPGEWWKERASGTVDTSRVQAWEGLLAPAEVTAVEVLCAEGMNRYGYGNRATIRETHAAFVLTTAMVRTYEPTFLRAAARGVRILPFRYEDVTAGPDPLVRSGPLLFFGDSLAGQGHRQRWQALRRLAQTLAVRVAMGRPCVRVIVDPAGHPVDTPGQIARGLIRLAATWFCCKNF